MKKRKLSYRIPEVSRTEIPHELSRLSSFIASIQRSAERERLFEALRKEHLLQSFHSICYAIPFPFLWLNCTISEELVLFGTQMELIGDSTLKVPLHVSYPIGFDLSRDDITAGTIHVFRHVLLPPPCVHCCLPEQMKIGEMLGKFKKRESHLDHVGRSLHKSLKICEDILEANQAENCP
jgi:hypothetical protein